MTDEEPNARTVVTARFGFSLQRGLAAYRRHLKKHIFPYPASTADLMDQRTAKKTLLNPDSIELLIYPWRFSTFVTPADIEAAGLEPKNGENDFVTRRSIGRMLWRQYGDEDPQPYEKKASRRVDDWIIFGLVNEVEVRDNLKELRGTRLLHDLLCTFFLNLSRGSSRKLIQDLRKEQPDG